MALQEYDLTARSLTELGASRPAAHLMLALALAVNRGTSVGELVDGLYEPLRAIVPFDRIGLAFTSDGKIEFKVIRSREAADWQPDETTTLGKCALTPVIAHRKVVIVDDLPAYVASTPQTWPLDILAAQGLRSTILLPLCRAGKTAGVLMLASRAEAAYGPQHIELLGAIATQLGTAFERAILVESLKKATRELLEVDRIKTNFLSTMSHELRTPLSQVLGFAYSLEDAVGADLSLNQLEDVRRIIEGAEKLRALFDDLFEFTALVSDRLKLSLVPVDAGEIAREVHAEMEPAIREAGLATGFERRGDDLGILADPPRVARVIRILVDNARRFTPRGGRVSVVASKEAGKVRVRVEDTGIGIARDEMERIFKDFYQIEAGPTRERGGTGIQLALARLIMNSHGGTLEVESEPGKGSTFTLSFPARAD